MFVAGEVLGNLSFSVARARLATAACAGSLGGAAAGAYGDGLADIAGAGREGSAPGIPELTVVRCGETVAHDESAVLALRWEACVPGGRQFLALDADITLIPVGEDVTRFSLVGVYRPPPVSPGAGCGQRIWRQAAPVTIRSFLARLLAVLDQDKETRRAEPGGLSLVPPGRGSLSWGGRTRRS